MVAVNVFAATNKQQIEKIKHFYGERAGKRATAWRALIQNSQHLSEQQKLQAVNDFFNQLYLLVMKNYGEKKITGQHPMNLLVRVRVIVKILVLPNTKR